MRELMRGDRVAVDLEGALGDPFPAELLLDASVPHSDGPPYSPARGCSTMLPLTLALSPSGGEGIDSPWPSPRERVGARGATASRIVRPREDRDGDG